MPPPRLDFASCDQRSSIVGSASQRAGLYYERQVTKWFARRFPLVAVQPALFCLGMSRPRYPDLLIFDETMRRCVIVEVKLQYTEKAFTQLNLYRFALSLAYPWLHLSSLLACGQLCEASTRPLLTSDENIFDLAEPCVLVVSKRELRMGRLHGLGGFGALACGAVR